MTLFVAELIRIWQSKDTVTFEPYYPNISVQISSSIIGPRREKPYLRRFANNKDADQPAHAR